MLATRKIEYQADGVELEGYCSFDNNTAEKRPAVLIVHDWSGRNEFAEKKAEKLAAMGYVGFALDMYGKGKLGNTKEEKTKLIEPLIKDRLLLRKRLLAALDTVKKIEVVDTSRIGVIGFCFGGLCALDLARSGANIKGVVSFHGLLSAPELSKEEIKAKILVLHGYNDPMVTAEDVLAFEKEMSDAKVDWQVHVYSNTMHGFTNPQANDPGFGILYNSLAEKRAWLAMQNFFAEIFA